MIKLVKIIFFTFSIALIFEQTVSATQRITRRAARAAANPSESTSLPEPKKLITLEEVGSIIDPDGIQMLLSSENAEDFLARIDTATQSIRQTSNRARVKPKPTAPFNADQAVYALIQARQDCVNAILQEGTGLTSLMRAAQSLSPAIVQALIDNGADVLAKDANDHDAKWHARQNKRRNIVALLNKAIKAQNAKKPKTVKRVCFYLPEEDMTAAQAANTASMAKAIEDVTNNNLVALPSGAVTHQTTRTWRNLLQAVCRRCCPRRG
jgi:hypothetical protein